MLEGTSKHDRIIRSAMALAETRGWRAVTLADIAAEAHVSLAAVYRRFRSKTAVLEAFIEALDAEVLSRSGQPDLNTPARDRVFEVVMTRLDVLKPYKNALRKIREEARCSLPGPGAARLLCVSANSQRWMLAAAGVPTDGGRGCLRVSGMACLYARVFPVWLRDDEPDLSRTMAVLDRELRHGERWLKRVDGFVEDLCRLACRFVPRRRGDAGYGPGRGPSHEPPPPPEPSPAPVAEQPGGA